MSFWLVNISNIVQTLFTLHLADTLVYFNCFIFDIISVYFGYSVTQWSN